ncbi:MAG TPA: FtsX-like permease family protein [Acetivibrio sp.]|uniref:FtsX-like permease family protein n=1 Tax=Acetivibrio sp. TaxID=1872092 RepID=UPI002CDC7B8F|nr:FtsX-like permease family protein [Acetivibrio sp.]HOM01733.1 FtsX-like permease family protein [Acetivibrio sp.]
MNIFYKLTLKILGKNKVRTLVTIIGIILSASMITAVTSCISSLQDFLVDMVIAQDGDWHGAVFDVSREQINDLLEDKEVKSLVWLQKIGYAMLEGSQNEYKPYLLVGAMGRGFKESMPVYLTEGRMPESGSEIILPKHVETNGGVKFKIGDTLVLSIGDRISDGFKLNQNNAFLHEKDGGDTEELIIREQRTFTVVGFYERPGFEPYIAPGYTALTIESGSGVGDYDYDAYIKLKKMGNITGFLDERFQGHARRINDDLLEFSGVINNGSFRSVLYGLAGILIALIMFGSILLIYNAFSISVSERTKQFGLLASIGATRRQMLKSVLFEACFLSLIGIPFGLLAGVLGIGITLKLTEDLFVSFLNVGYGVVLDLDVSLAAVVVAVVVGFVTVLISAYLPARRALKISPIDAIRQTNDIKIKAKKVKTSKLTYKLFGFEGMIASKNFKRNRKKYRTTVVSLFMSVVLFISASSFCAYLTEASHSVVDDSGYDIIYTFTTDMREKYSLDELYEELAKVSGVIDSSYGYTNYGVNEYARISTESLNREYVDFCNKIFGENHIDMDSGYYVIPIVISFIDDATYEEYLKQNSIVSETNSNPDMPGAVLVDFVKIYAEGKFYTFNVFDKKAEDIRIEKLEDREAVNGEKLNIIAVTDNTPLGVYRNSSNILTLIYPFSAISEVSGEEKSDVDVVMYFKAKDHRAVFDRIYRVLDEKKLPTVNLFDYAEVKESSRALVTVVNVFSYGFIVLISLIALANVFNTISTNFSLRRREFAMLKSIGMTEKGFNKMMNYECLLYGIKGLMYGIPVSIGVTYLIYRSIIEGWETKFFIPWYSIVITVGSVFIVVFSTMLYSMSKIKKDNPIDALRNENL